LRLRFRIEWKGLEGRTRKGGLREGVVWGKKRWRNSLDEVRSGKDQPTSFKTLENNTEVYSKRDCWECFINYNLKLVKKRSQEENGAGAVGGSGSIIDKKDRIAARRIAQENVLEDS